MFLNEIRNVLRHGKKRVALREAYHITTTTLLPSIMSTGLRVGSGNKNYQYTSPAIFLTDNITEDTLERIGSIVLTGGRTEQEMETSPPIDDLIIIRVNLAGWDHPIYIDDVMKLAGCFYTEHPIPATRLQVLGRVDFVSLKIVPL